MAKVEIPGEPSLGGEGRVEIRPVTARDPPTGRVPGLCPWNNQTFTTVEDGPSPADTFFPCHFNYTDSVDMFLQFGLFA